MSTLNTIISNDSFVCRSTADGLLSRVKTLEFTTTLILWEQILTKAYRVSNCIQAKSAELTTVTKALESLYKYLDQIENNWEGILNAAKMQAELAGADKTFKLAVRRNLYCYSGRVRGQNIDEPSKERVFHASVFLPSVRACKKQAKLRFAGHMDVVDRFTSITPRRLIEAEVNDLKKEADELRKVYSNDLTAEFPQQLADFRTDFGDQLNVDMSSGDILSLILKHDLSPLYPDVVTALTLFLTLPVTVATAERSFSKLKLIKTYLRSTMSQERLSGLSTLSIESGVAKGLDKVELAKLFGLAKSKRAKLF